MLKTMTPDELREAAQAAGEDIAELHACFAHLPADQCQRGLAILDKVLGAAGLLADPVRDHLAAAGRKGGLARKASITKRKARAIARKAAKASWVSRRAKAAKPKCIGNNPLCPCQDGDLCHYKGPDAWPIPEAKAAK